MLNRRDRRNPNKMLVHVTNRTKEGLPFLARMFMTLIILGIMARGQKKYNVQICHFLWMSNHYHMILGGRGKHISPFLGYVEAELAKTVKRLTYIFGNRIGNVWERRFREQKICTGEDALRMIIYLYTNPVKAGLVSRATHWKGCSSLNMYLSGTNSIIASWLPTRKMSKLPLYITHKVDLALVKWFKLEVVDTDVLRIMPNIWKNYFHNTKNWTDEYILRRILAGIKEAEELAKKVHNGHFMGMKAVQQQAVNRRYIPEKKGRTPYLICGDDELRVQEILSYKEFCKQCKIAFKKWKQGVYTAKYVYGAYRPSMSILGSLRAEVAKVSKKAIKKAELRKAFTFTI